MIRLGTIGLTVGALFVWLAVYGINDAPTQELVRKDSEQAQDKAKRMRPEGAEIVQGYYWTFWHDTETGTHFACMQTNHDSTCVVTNPSSDVMPPTGLEAKPQ